MEQIYTIPVTEAFEKCRDNQSLGCPFCQLFLKLEEDELDIILGASMMEPDIRIKTNEMGFCLPHYKKMLIRKRRLGMGLILESHLNTVKSKIKPSPKDLVLGVGATGMDALSVLEKDCYVCSRIEKNLSAMTATAVYLYETKPDFSDLFRNQPYFCLPHFRKMAEYAKKKCNKKVFADLYKTSSGIVAKYLDTLTDDVSWFCKKFDYQFENEPWYNSKDSVERAIKFLSSDNGEIS